MKNILSLMAIDFKLICKNIFFWILLGMLVIIILVVNFLLPKERTSKYPEIITYGFDTQVYRQAKNMDDLEYLVKKADNTVGIAFEKGDYIIIANNLTEKQATGLLLPFLPEKRKKTPISVSKISDNTSVPPFNKSTLPVFICFEALVQGFLLAGVLMLNEKSSKILGALQVSPLRGFHYWASKMILFSIIGVAYALLMTIFTMGTAFPIIPFILISLIATSIFTMIGLITASFFRSLNNWFMLVALIMGINMLTLFAYLFPSLSFSYMQLIPSYPFIFLYEQLLFGHLNWTSNAISILLWFSILCALSLHCITKVFLRPQKGV